MTVEPRSAEAARVASVFQTLLFVPGARAERFPKALDAGADVVCIDLEDSVPTGQKASAREASLAFIAEQPTQALALRCNGVCTRAGVEDLLALAGAPVLPALLLVPMVESCGELEVIAGALGDRCPALLPLIETARGVAEADAIAGSRGVAGLMFGGGDLSAQLGAELAWEPMLTVRSQLVLACARAAVRAVDVPWLAIDDEAGLVDETKRCKALGFSAKAAIHPKQVAPMKAVFRPSDDEIEFARAAIDAFESADRRAIAFRGLMLDEPVVARLQATLQLAGNP